MSVARAIEPACRVLRAAAVAVALAVLCELAACALIPGARSSSVRPVLSTHTSEAIAALAKREGVLHSMRTGAVMKYSAANGRHFMTHEQIAMKRPANLRVEALSPFGATMVLTADDAGRLMIFDPSNNRLLSGSANAATLARYVRIPMAPAEAIDLLMGLAPDPAQLETPPDSVTLENGMTVVGWRLDTGGTRELGFIGERLAMVRERDARGERRYEVRYADWRPAGDVSFPHKVDADFPASRFTVRYEAPVLNAILPASIFVLTPGPATKRLSIGAGATAGAAD
jgi:hypothetical protein